MTGGPFITLDRLTRGIAGLRLVGDPEVRVDGISYDSRRVGKGHLFAAVPGTRVDGARYISQAIEAGARAVLTTSANGAIKVPAVIAPDVRLAMGQLAARIYGHPDHDIEVVCITGTNGKTTTSYLLEAILQKAGKRPGVIGTVNYRFGSSIQPANTTTPESVDIFSTLASMKQGGATHAVMEISSHALDQRRAAGLRVRYAVFTNLSRDHLDYHADLEDYFAAKRRLFTEVITGKWVADAPSAETGPVAMINLDDPYGVRLKKEVGKLGIRCLGFAVENRDAEIRAREIQISDQGLNMILTLPGAEFPVRSALIGLHNVENIMAAAAAAHVLGLAPEEVAEGVAGLSRVPGRLEPVPNPQGITVLVDYAHTPDALDHAVDTCAAVARGRLITVFGCGGDRDRGKRPIMGGIAVRGSDLAIITSDNPRTEDPDSIIAMVREGAIEAGGTELKKKDMGGEWRGPEGKRGRRPAAFVIEPDRRSAIGLAVGIAKRGDLVLIAGKGHEDYQILGTEKIHFDDREEAAKALSEREDK